MYEVIHELGEPKPRAMGANVEADQDIEIISRGQTGVKNFIAYGSIQLYYVYLKDNLIDPGEAARGVGARREERPNSRRVVVQASRT